MTNGDTLSGSLHGVAGGIVELETEYAGTLRLEQELVKEIRSESVFHIVDTSGMQSHGLFNDNVDIASVRLARIELQDENTGAVGLSNQLDLSASYSQGNSATQVYLLTTETELTRPQSEHVFKSALSFDVVEREQLKNQIDISYKTRHFFKEKWFYALNADGYRDPIKMVDLRLAPAIGLGHRFWEHNYGKLTVEAGVATIFEQADELESTDPALSWELEFSKRLLGGRLEAIHEHRVVSTFGDGLVVDSVNGLKYDLLENVNLNLLATLRHDTQVPSGVEKTDITYVTGVGLSF